jgi:AcrR family transcriptional regulator
MTRVGLRERKKIDTRARIMQAALALFERRGIGEVTVDEIAAEADVGKGTVYNYFAAKDDIASAFLIEIDRDALETMALLPTDAMGAAEALDTAAWSLLEHKGPYREFVRAYLARTLGPGTFAQDQVEFQAQLDAVLGGLFTRLLARPGMSAKAVIPDLILSFKTMHFGISAIWALEGPPFATARRLTHDHMSLLAKALEP